MHYWSTFGARTSHGQIWTHKTHHGPDLGEATTFPLIIYSAPLREARIQMVFCFETLILPKLQLLWLCGGIPLCEDLQSGWGLKQSCNLCQDLSNDVLHAIFTQGNWVDTWLLVVGSQIANLILGLSFGHNLCFKCPNGSCDPTHFRHLSSKSFPMI